MKKSRNIVAKFMRRFNKATIHRNKKKYKRKDKWSGKKGSNDSFLLAPINSHLQQQNIGSTEKTWWKNYEELQVYLALHYESSEASPYI